MEIYLKVFFILILIVGSIILFVFLSKKLIEKFSIDQSFFKKLSSYNEKKYITVKQIMKIDNENSIVYFSVEETNYVCLIGGKGTILVDKK